MSPFRRKSDLRSVAGDPVFIDLGTYVVPEGDRVRRTHIVRISDEGDLDQLNGLTQTGDTMVLDLSEYHGDTAVAEDIVMGTTSSSDSVLYKINANVWIIAPDGSITEHPKGE